MQFDCACLAFCGQACFVVLVQALRCLFATPLSLGRLGNCMFPSKVCRHSVPLFVFTYFQADGVRFVFFCVQVGRRPCWCRLCVVFRNTIAVWAGWATACFPSKVCRHSVFFSFAVFSDEKMCCNRFLLMRFRTTLLALFHV